MMFKVGDRVILVNYPELSYQGSLGTIISLPTAKFCYYEVILDGDSHTTLILRNEMMLRDTPDQIFKDILKNNSMINVQTSRRKK